MLTGWWKVSDMEELRALAKALHSRGVREKALQKQIQKHMEYIAQACAKNRDGEHLPIYWPTLSTLYLYIHIWGSWRIWSPSGQALGICCQSIIHIIKHYR